MEYHSIAIYKKDSIKLERIIQELISKYDIDLSKVKIAHKTKLLHYMIEFVNKNIDKFAEFLKKEIDKE